MNGQLAGIPGGTPGAIAVGGVLVALLAFGLIYNWAVGKVKRRRPNFPSSILVVIGVIVTSIGVAFLDLLTTWPALMINAVAFTFAGGPMIIGDVWRTTEQDEQQAKQARQKTRRLAKKARKLAEADDGDETPTLPESVE